MTTIIAPATFDYVCHALKCPRCGETSSSDPCGIDLQTKLREHPTMSALRVGDPLGVRSDPYMGGYLIMHAPGDPLRVIEEWICDACGTGFLWAVLEVRNGILTSVETIELNEATVNSADLITGQALFLFPTVHSSQLLALDAAELSARIVKAEADRLAELTKDNSRAR